MKFSGDRQENAMDIESGCVYNHKVTDTKNLVLLKYS